MTKSENVGGKGVFDTITKGLPRKSTVEHTV